MNRLAKIVQSATPSTGVQFRKRAYGKNGVENFLHDVLAISNASVDGPRYIITGVELDNRSRRNFHAIASSDFSGKPAYEALATDHIEPQIRISYEPVTIDGARIGVFEIGDCQDRPYMMRVDHSETLRRGDAYVRVNDAAVKMGRRQLRALFEMSFQDSISASSIEVGFPGKIIHKRLKVATRKLAKLPSAVAGAKLHELVEARNKVNMSMVSTIVARLTHARLFGSDSPYEHRSTEEILAEMQQLEQQYRDHDQYFLFEENATAIQLVVCNQSDEPLKDASFSIVMPQHDDFHVASQLPMQKRNGDFVPRATNEQQQYPAVTRRGDGIQVAGNLGDIVPGEPVEIFPAPLRICVGPDLKGRRIGIQYSLQARNLRSAAKGTLRLLF